MPKILIATIFIFSSFLLRAQGKKIYLVKGGDNGCLFTQAANCQPGDTLVVRAALNPWSYIYLGGLSGSEQKPVVVINEGRVQLTAGLDIDNCRYIRITGSKGPDKYGFHISGSSTALTIHGRSSHIEADHFYATDGSFGCWIKNEASCDTSINNWVLDHISVHDFELHHMKIEGFYMGTTDPDNTSRPVSCNGQSYFYKPSQLGNIRIYNGIIDGTGRPALQLSNARVGMSEIFNNIITNVGREGNDQQGTGISLGGYTRAWVHHNTIRNTLTWGIASIGGSGLVRIENNTIDSSGYLDGRSLNWPQNIMIDTRATTPADSTRFIIRNNRLSNPGKDVSNIQVWRSFPTYGAGNIICNNLTKGKPASVKVAAGIRWNNCGIAVVNPLSQSFPAWWFLLGGGIIVLLLLFVLIKKRTTANNRRTVLA